MNSHQAFRSRARRLAVLITAVLSAAGVTLAAVPQSAQAVTSGPPWPASPNYASYGEAPSSAKACPVAITSTAGAVSGAANLICGGSGGATMTMVTGGATPSIVLDYGVNVGGVPYFTTSAETGSPTLTAGYSEALPWLTPAGDGATPWASGDGARNDTYTVTSPGTITNQWVQGGERYEELTLTSPGTLTLNAVGIGYIADRTAASAYPGYFASSSDTLNKIWYDGAYTDQLDAVPASSLPGDWRINGAVLDATGGNGKDWFAGPLNQGATWSNYTTTFDARIVTSQAGWVVRAQDAEDSYMFILNDSTDAVGSPNQLQEFSVHNGNYTSLGTASLPASLVAGTWHTIATTVSGSTISVSVDGALVATLTNTTYTVGTVGFREGIGEEADFRNLNVASSGTTLFSNALSTTSALSDFAVPGVNPVPSFVDGATRDRAIWSGDLNVEGPTDFYSIDQAAYMKGALQLLGTYAQSSGVANGDEPPQAPLLSVTGAANSYSASYSIYWLLGLGSYYLYTGDSAFVTQEWPAVQAELNWTAGLVDSNGLLATNSSNGADWDYYDTAKTGEVTEYNILYYQSLVEGAQLATVAGQPSLSATYTSRAAALKTAINAHLFNSATGLYYISNTAMSGVAQDANALSVLYGVAPTANDASILAGMKSALWTNPNGPEPFSSNAGESSIISPFVSGDELEARFAQNDTANAQALLTTLWGPMVAPGANFTGTLWENVGASGGVGSGTTSYSHGWSTAPTAALSAYVLGIQPVTAGYATWLVQPHPADLSWVEGQAPTPHGTIAVQWAGQSSLDQFAMQVTAPAGTTGTIAVPTYGATNPIVEVGGQTAWSGGTFTAVAGIGGAHADSQFVYLTGVQPGTYLVAMNKGNASIPAGDTACAAEASTCTFSGTQWVAFGANGVYTYQSLTNSVACNATTFGDPDYGIVKACYVGPAH